MKTDTFIKNPLTVIAVFASLTEIVCGTVTPFISDSYNQKLFLIFVVGFPILLVISFFLTLNLNHKVLYSPSDFNDSNERIADLFYGSQRELEKIKVSNKVIRKENSLNIISIEELPAESQPYILYAKKFFEKVESLLPIIHLSEINFDSQNDSIHTLEIRIKPEYLKQGFKPREVFVLLISHREHYNKETYESSKEKITTGLIAGSGIENIQAQPNELALYVFQEIKERMK